MRATANRILLGVWLAFSASAGFAQPTLPADTKAAIDAAVAEVLASSGAPSASIAVVRDGAIVYEHAYGFASLDPEVPATPAMRYSIGSVSKQFTAAAVLMLVEEGKLSLDDRVVRWFPELTRSNEVTLRQLLSMTSGYRDFWPHDYVPPFMLQATTPQQLFDVWARKPLDFDPGTRWQYSNTNYTIVGALVERAAGRSVWSLLQERVFTPLGMKSVLDVDQHPLPDGEPVRYERYGLGPSRQAPKEAAGWLFAAGELAMTPHDLALWDLSLIGRTLLSPESYAALEQEVRLADGRGTGYGLGISVRTRFGRRLLTHNGEVSGFSSRNDVFPEDGTAVIALVNLFDTGAAADIAGRIEELLFAASDRAAVDQARAILLDLQQGKVDRTLLTDNARAYFTPQALADFASSLGPLGTPGEIELLYQGSRGGMTQRNFAVELGGRQLRVRTFLLPDGKVEQYQVSVAE